MARPVTTLVIFFIAFNLFAGMLMTTGVAGAIGIDAAVGEDDAIDQQTSNDGLETGTGSGSTLFGMYNVLFTQLSGFFRHDLPRTPDARTSRCPDVYHLWLSRATV